MKALPIGVQSFADLRKKDNLYVDKTKEIHHLITSGKIFFLSRPRRLRLFFHPFAVQKKEIFQLPVYVRYDYIPDKPNQKS